MKQDEIIDMARKAGFFINDKLTITSPFIEDICISPMLKEFAKLVAEAEREACAKIVEESSLPDTYSEECLPDIANEIRARGDKNDI